MRKSLGRAGALFVALLVFAGVTFGFAGPSSAAPATHPTGSPSAKPTGGGSGGVDPFWSKWKSHKQPKWRWGPFHGPHSNWPLPPYSHDHDHEHVVVSVSNTHPYAGHKITVNVSGVKPGNSVVVTIGGHNVGTFKTDKSGDVSCGITIPGLPPGKYTITATDTKTGKKSTITIYVQSKNHSGGGSGGWTSSAPPTGATTETTTAGGTEPTAVTSTPPVTTGNGGGTDTGSPSYTVSVTPTVVPDSSKVTTTTVTTTVGGVDATSETRPASGAAAGSSSSSGGGGLAFTGAAVVGLGVLAVAMLGSGLVLLFLGRRRRPWHSN